MPRTSPYATPKEVADELRCSIRTLSQHRYLGEGLPYVKFGRRVLYRWTDVDAYVEAHVTTRTGAA